MIVRKFFEKYVRTYSDKKRYIRKVGTNEIYSEAIDIKVYDYEETDQVIEEPLIEENYEVPEQDI